jgi:flagellar basal-body rod modification protein FlgD
MTVSPTEATGPTALSGLVSGTATAASEDKELFLELLVAQLRYQDPMNPADSGEFLAQSAQFTALEKMQAVADQVGLLLNAQLAFGATGMLGQQVDYLAADGTTRTTGTVRGVTYDAAGPVLDVDGTDVPIGSVVSVTSAALSSASGPAGTTGTDSTTSTSAPQPA